MVLDILRLDALEPDFYKRLNDRLSHSENASSIEVDQSVAKILDSIRLEGDDALLSFTQQFDDVGCRSATELEIKKEQLREAFESLEVREKQALLLSKERIERYHSNQVIQPWSFEDEQGHKLGQKITPMQKVGMYVPGGKASYPSSVLMNAIPAKVAGVEELVMVVPAPGNELNEMVLAAAWIAGVDRVFKVGGAQAIGALAYGTELVPKVDKIVGPGNQYVASAKKQVFGVVGIDMIAGPSEILVYCDEKSDPDWVAMDLFSQAEHDEMAQSILVCESDEFISKVEKSILSLLPEMDRRKTIEASLKGRGVFIKVNGSEQALQVINHVAPEHLELSFDDDYAQELAGKVINAGAIFIGRATAEAFGDYCAGSNHVLPTAGSARFSSPLSVYDFFKRTSLVYLNQSSIDDLAQAASVLARAEGLEAHARSAEFRLNKKSKY